MAEDASRKMNLQELQAWLTMIDEDFGEYAESLCSQQYNKLSTIGNATEKIFLEFFGIPLGHGTEIIRAARAQVEPERTSPKVLPKRTNITPTNSLYKIAIEHIAFMPHDVEDPLFDRSRARFLFRRVFGCMTVNITSFKEVDGLYRLRGLGYTFYDCVGLSSSKIELDFQALWPGIFDVSGYSCEKAKFHVVSGRESTLPAAFSSDAFRNIIGYVGSFTIIHAINRSINGEVSDPNVGRFGWSLNTELNDFLVPLIRRSISYTSFFNYVKLLEDENEAKPVEQNLLFELIPNMRFVCCYTFEDSRPYMDIRLFRLEAKHHELALALFVDSIEAKDTGDVVAKVSGMVQGPYAEVVDYMNAMNIDGRSMKRAPRLVGIRIFRNPEVAQWLEEELGPTKSLALFSDERATDLSVREWMALCDFPTTMPIVDFGSQMSVIEPPHVASNRSRPVVIEPVATVSEEKSEEKQEVEGLDDDEPQVLTLQSGDQSFEISEDACTISGMIETIRAADMRERNIKLSVEPFALEKAVEYMQLAKENQPSTIQRPVRSTNMREFVLEWEAVFVDSVESNIFEVLHASNYMDIKPLFELICAKVATMLVGKTLEQVRLMFGIPENFSSEELSALRAENEWEM